MIYLDNSASTNFKPPSVINAVTVALKNLSANPGRSGHALSLRAGLLVNRTRENAAKMFGFSPDRMVFCLNCTEALNFAIYGTLIRGGHIITTAYEHNSVLRPLFGLQRDGLISVTVLPPNENGIVNAEMIKKHITAKTYMIITNHVSNVTGAITPVAEIGKLAKANKLLYLVDGAQSGGYTDINAIELNIDLLALAPHKGLHAPQGIGLLGVGENVRIRPLILGGTGTVSQSVYQPLELPESMESGTLPTPAIAGLNAALFWTNANAADMRKKLSELSAYALEEFKSIKNLTVYTPKNVYNGIVSFNIDGLDSTFISDVLSEQYDICTRSGLQCAPLIHKHLGTLERGIVRASFGCENKFSEIEFFVKAIKDIASAQN